MIRVLASSRKQQYFVAQSYELRLVNWAGGHADGRAGRVHVVVGSLHGSFVLSLNILLFLHARCVTRRVALAPHLTRVCAQEMGLQEFFTRANLAKVVEPRCDSRNHDIISILRRLRKLRIAQIVPRRINNNEDDLALLIVISSIIPLNTA